MIRKTIKLALISGLLCGAIDQVRAYDYTPTTNPETVASNVQLSTGNNTFTIPTGYLSTFTGVISNAPSSSGILVKTGNGTLVLNGANTYTGGTLLQSGTIRLGNGSALGSWPASPIDGNAQGLVTVSGTGTIQTMADMTIRNRFVTSGAAATLTFNIASGTTLAIQNVNNLGANVNAYGGAIFTSSMGAAPSFSGGGALLIGGNRSSFGGGISSTGSAGNVGFDLTELSSVSFLNNTAYAGNGGAVYSVATGTNRALLELGDRVTVAGNLATTTGTAGDGGGIFAYSSNGTSVNIGTRSTFTNNEANRYGGAIYAFAASVGSEADLILGTNALFDGNRSKAPTAARAGGGAIYSTHNATLHGNTLFRNNAAMSYGGAIFMKGREAGVLLLDTTDGDIGFTGNFMNVANIASPAATGTANSVFLDTLSTLKIQGTENVYFDDPIASADKTGNAMVIGRDPNRPGDNSTFDGFVQFRGNSTLLNDFRAVVSDGTMRLVNAQFGGATAGSFSLGPDGTLAGTGTIGFGTNTISGTIAPDATEYRLRSYDTTTNSFTGNDFGSTNEFGTLNFTGTTRFDGATLLIDIDTLGYDTINVTGAVTFGTVKNNVISLKDAAIGGVYNIITSNQTIVGDPSQFFSVAGNIEGIEGFSRYGANVRWGSGGGSNNIVQVVIGSQGGNTTLYWTGGESDQWVDNVTSGPRNWTDVPGGTPSETRFLNGDRVIFDTDHTVGPSAVSVPSAVTIADMTVTGSDDYTFTGGGITAQTTGTTLTDATGRLTKDGSGTLTFANAANSFTGGVSIRDGKVVVQNNTFGGSAVALGKSDGTGNATLEFNTTGNDTSSGVISGSGNLVKSGTGTLTLSGTNSFTGGSTTVSGGTLVGNIADGTSLKVAAGTSYRNGTTPTTQRDRTLSSLEGAGGVDLGGRNLTVGGGDFSEGFLSNVSSLTKTGPGTFIVGTKNNSYGTDGRIALDTLTVGQGTFEIDRTPDGDKTTPKIDVAGTAVFKAGSVTSIGRELAIEAASVVVEAGAALDVCSCSGTNITLIHSDAVIANDFIYTIGGVAVRDVNQVTIHVFVDGVSIERRNGDHDIVIEAGGLVWNNDYANSAHGTFEIGTSFEVAQVLADNTNSADWYADPESGRTWDGKTLTKTGAGTLTLNAANTYTGNTNIIAGKLVAKNVQAVGTTGAAVISDGASLELNFTGTFANALQGGSGSLLSTRGDVAIVRNNGSFAGSTSIVDGTLTLGDVGAVGSSTIANGGVLRLDFSDRFDNGLTGGGSLEIAASRNVTISRSNTGFTGTTSIVAGAALNLSDAAAIGTSAIADNGTLSLDFDGTFANVLTGAGQLNLNGDITVSRYNTFAGSTTVAAGKTLTLQNISGIGNDAAQTLRNDGILVFGLANDGTNVFAQKITGAGSLVKNGNGTLVLDNAANDYSGKTAVASGILVADLAPAVDVSLPCGTELAVAAGATYRARSRKQSVANLTGAGIVEMQSFDLDVCSGDFTDGTIDGVGTLTKTSPDSETNTVLTVGNVTGTNLAHANGTLNIASGKTIALTGAADFSDGTILNVGAATAVTAAGSVTIGAGTVLNVTGYENSMGKIVLIDAGRVIANDFETNAINGTDQRTTISIDRYLNTGPIIQRNREDMSQIVIDIGGLVWNNTANGTAHGSFNVGGSATIDGDLSDNTVPGSGFENWDGKTLTKTGDGTLTLTGNNSYTGDTNVDGGKIVGTNPGAFGTGSVNLGGGTSVEFNTNGDGTAVNDISGTGSLVKTGDGVLKLTGTNGYTGGTTVDGGSLVTDLPDASVDPPCGTPLLVKAGATFKVYGRDQSISNLTGNGTVDMQADLDGRNKNLTVCSGDISGGSLLNTATLTKKSAAMFTVGTATVESLHLAEGTLKIAETKTITVTGDTVIDSGTTLNVAANPALITDTLTIGNGTILDICGCSVDGWIVKSNNNIAGQFTDVLVGGVALTDEITIDRFINGLEVFYVDADDPVDPEGPGIKVASGGLVWNNRIGDEPDKAHGTFNIATTFTVTQVLADRMTGDYVPVDGWDGKTLTKKGDGLLTLVNDSNNYSGGTEILAGKIIARAAGALGTGTVTNNGLLEYDIDTDGTAANPITGGGTLTKNGTGTLTLTGDNTYTGETNILEGALVSNLAAPTAALPCGTALNVEAGATYRPYDRDQFVSKLTGSGTVDMGIRNLTVCSGDFRDGRISVATLTKTSPLATVPTSLVVGNVTGENLDLQIGVLTIAAGKTVALTGNAMIGDSTTLGMTAADAPALTAGGNVTIGTGTTLDVAGYDAAMGTVVLIDAGSDILNEFGVYRLNGTEQRNTVTLADYRNRTPIIQRNHRDLSQVVISSGGLVWNNTAPGTAHGTFDLAVDDTISEVLSDNSLTSAMYADPATGRVWDGKTLTKTGPGTLTLAAENVYTGGTKVEQGTLVAGNENALGTGKATVEDGGKLKLGYSGTFANLLEGSGRLEIGNSMNILGSNTDFDGSTDITAKTTTLQKSDGLGSSAVTVAGGATLDFNLASDGTASNDIGGAGNLSKRGGGTLVLSGRNGYAGTTTVSAGTLVGNIASGTDLLVAKNAAYRSGNADRTVGTLNGTGSVDMQNRNLTVGGGEFCGGTLNDVGLFTKNTEGRFNVGSFTATGFNLAGGTLYICNNGRVDVSGTAVIGDGTTLDIGAVPALNVAGTVTIGEGTTLNISGYDSEGEVVLVRSNTGIIGDFDDYTINGTSIRDQVPSLDRYYIVDGIEKTSDLIRITDGHLAWNDRNEESSHGHFLIDAGTATISTSLADNTDSGTWMTNPGGDPLWDGKTLTKTGNGTLVLSGVNDYTGDTVVIGGSIVVTNEHSLGRDGGGIVRLGNNGANLLINYDGIFGKTVAGAGTIGKIDAGTTVLTADLSGASGIFAQDGGTIDWRTGRFGGSFEQDGGKLIAHGTMSVGGDAAFRGEVTPGGALTVDGMVNLDGADLYVNLYLNETSPEPAADHISGKRIFIDDSTLHVDDKGVIADYLRNGSAVFTVLKSTDGISGDFREVTGITSIFTETHGVFGNDYVIELSIHKKPFDPFAPNHNTQEVVDTIHDGLGDPDLGPLVDDLINMDSDEEIADAVDQLRGTEIAADAQTLALWSPWRSVFARLYGEERSKAACNPCDPVCAAGKSVRNAWFEGYYRDENVSNDGNARSYDIRRGGMMVGLDSQLTRRLTLGGVFGYGDPRLVSRFGRIEADDYTLGLYGKFKINRQWFSNAFVGYGRQRFDYHRRDFAGNYRAKYDGDAMYTSFELVRPIYGKYVTWMPVAAIDFQKSWTDGFGESGTGYTQIVRKSDLSRTELRFGLNAKARWSERLDLLGRVQYGRQVGGNTHGTANSGFAMSPNSRPMNLLGVDQQRDRLNAGFGCNWSVGAEKRSSFFCDYDFDYAENYRAHTGQIGFTTRW